VVAVIQHLGSHSHTSFDVSTPLYVADRLAREMDDHPDNAKGIPLRESDDALIGALGLSQQYSALREQAMEPFT
jgi:hypothetical protein